MRRFNCKEVIEKYKNFQHFFNKLYFLLQDTKNASYIENLQKLEGLALVKFENDTMVVPRESSWFGFYAPGQSEKVLPYHKTELYKKVIFWFKEFLNFKNLF